MTKLEESVHHYFDENTDSELLVPYFKTHLENGYDAVLVGCDGAHGRYRIILFDSDNKLISSLESQAFFQMESELFKWANKKIDDQFPRNFIIKDASNYLDKHVIDDADTWAKMTRESYLLEKRRKRANKKEQCEK